MAAEGVSTEPVQADSANNPTSGGSNATGGAVTSTSRERSHFSSIVACSTTTVLLDENNYAIWAFGTSIFLKRVKLWQHFTDVDAAKATMSNEQWEDEEVEAIDILLQRMQPAVQRYIRRCSTVKEMWSELSARYKPTGALAKWMIRRKLHSLRYVEGASIERFFQEACDLRDDLTDIGGEYADCDFAYDVLLHLPPSFDTTVQTVLAQLWGDGELSIARVKTALLLESFRRKAKEPEENEAPPAVVSKKGGVPTGPHPAIEWKKRSACKKCGETGHWWSDPECPMYEESFPKRKGFDNLEDKVVYL